MEIYHLPAKNSGDDDYPHYPVVGILQKFAIHMHNFLSDK